MKKVKAKRRSGSDTVTFLLRAREEDRFFLANDPPAVKPAEYEDQERSRQRVLIDGMDCLPGQTDLF